MERNLTLGVDSSKEIAMKILGENLNREDYEVAMQNVTDHYGYYE